MNEFIQLFAALIASGCAAAVGTAWGFNRGYRRGHDVGFSRGRLAEMREEYDGTTYVEREEELNERINGTVQTPATNSTGKRRKSWDS